MKKGSGTRLLIATLVLVLSLSLGGGIVAAQGTGPFVIECIGNGMTIWNGPTAAFYVDLGQISVPLSTAIAIHQNQPVVIGATVSLWALKSNELQVQYTGGPDSTKLVVSPDVCGTIPSVIGVPVQTTSPAPAVGVVYPFYWQYGLVPGALAPAQPVTPAPASSGKVHVVQAGENLFRIALKYGLTYSQLAAYNGITNPSLIYAGQQIRIP
ncbi:LysM peptidoglycan-binding domain-containing protein [Aggregatilinea lenta]|uniref:LysM peptidoglycan-binding domain-containing protein n=1 Tax=Aggregatilinea lenta TaxID=913108 RepID=UPI000E5B062D|nr:LysM domain-containing protein [Aggregatilinea lenta]